MFIRRSIPNVALIKGLYTQLQEPNRASRRNGCKIGILNAGPLSINYLIMLSTFKNAVALRRRAFKRPPAPFFIRPLCFPALFAIET